MNHRHWIALVLSLAAAQADGQEPIPVEFDGMEVFGQIVSLQGVEPLASQGELWNANPSESMFVIVGDMKDIDWGRVKAFREMGGALLIASDRSRTLDFLGVRIDGRAVLQDERTAFRRSPACPLLKVGNAHPLFTGVQDLATNGPSFLSIITKDGLEPRLFFPENCQVKRLPGNYSPPGPLYIATQDKPGPGRTIVMAGHGVFFNGMLLPGGQANDNLRFSWNCLHWLRQGPTGTRTKVLFLENGQAITSLGLPLRLALPQQLPTPPASLPAETIVDRLVTNLERDDAFDRLLYDLFGRDNLLRFVLFMASCGLLLYGAWSILRGRYRIDRRAAIVIDPVELPGLAATPLQLRQQAQADVGNYWELAQVLVRHWFWQHAAIEPARWDASDFHLPSFVINGPWWRRWRISGNLKNLEKLAVVPLNWPMSPRRLRQVRRLLEQMTAAVRGGELAFPKPV